MARYVVVDTETTGLSTIKGRHRVIEIALVEVVNSKLTGNTFQTYINPEGRKSTPNAIRTHKLKDSFLLDKPLFKTQLPQILDFIGKSQLVFFNEDFDLEFLDNEAKLAGSQVRFSTDYKTTCVQKQVTSATRRKRHISLDNACRMYGVDTSLRKVHGALIDAQLTAELFIALNSNSERITKVPNKAPRSTPEKFPLPRAYENYQINFCKNPRCANYGKPPKFPEPIDKDKFTNNLGDYEVKVVRLKRSDSRKMLFCKLCNSSSIVFSNKSLVQEIKRLKSIYRLQAPSCPNTALHPDKRKGIPDGRRYEQIVKKVRGKELPLKRLKPPCENVGKSILKHPDLYWLDSKNSKKLQNTKGLPKIVYPDSKGKYHNIREAVSQTFKCKSCHTKFSAPINPQKGQHNQQINYALFSLLVNKGIINRISEVLRINHDLIYSRIEFFYHQCIQFEQFQIFKNIKNLESRNLHLSIDRLHFFANWTSREDARRTPLFNTATVENNTRFVFGSTLNFDFTSDYISLYKEFKRIGEYSKEPFKRRYQQYNLPDENLLDDDTTTPKKHLLVQQTYSMIAHLELLKDIIANANSAYIYADNDGGLDISITKVFKDLILERKVQACCVRKGKLKPDEIELDSGFQWISQNEPVIEGKHLDLKLLTNCDLDMLENASLHGVDNFFQILRRRLSMVERPFKSVPNNNDKINIENDLSSENTKFEKWNLYGSYNPKYVSMLIEIVRVFNNFILTDEKSIKNKKGLDRIPTTPAQKIGFANKPFDIHDILEFSVTSSALQANPENIKSIA